MRSKRFQIYAEPTRLDAVKQRLPDHSDSSIFECALSLLEWTLGERDKGRVVTSMNMPFPTVTVLNMPNINLVTSI